MQKRRNSPTPSRGAAQALVAWFIANRRQLPWRPEDHATQGRDPYRTWISEIMLQQTQVVTVLEHYRRWMLRFPDVLALASSEESDVLEAWTGLGYYSRARNLLHTAREIVGAHDGVFPSDRRTLLALKGVGEYTAGAIASLAFNLPEPILDGNLVRVFSRVYGLDFLPDTAERKKTYWDLAKAWVETQTPALVNEGLMELGALICTPRQPKCNVCPLAAGCYARAHSAQNRFPPPKARKDTLHISGTAVLVFAGNKVLLRQPPKKEWLAGLWTFPLFLVTSLPAVRRAWTQEFPEWKLPDFRILSVTVSHSITHHQFKLSLVEGKLAGKDARGKLPEGYAWTAVEDLDQRLVSSLPRKLWKAVNRPNP